MPGDALRILVANAYLVDEANGMGGKTYELAKSTLRPKLVKVNVGPLRKVLDAFCCGRNLDFIGRARPPGGVLAGIAGGCCSVVPRTLLRTRDKTFTQHGGPRERSAPSSMSPAMIAKIPAEE